MGCCYLTVLLLCGFVGFGVDCLCGVGVFLDLLHDDCWGVLLILCLSVSLIVLFLFCFLLVLVCVICGRTRYFELVLLV